MLTAINPLLLLGAESAWTVAGLPLHPLVVHGAVVLVPMSAALFALLVFRPGLRVTYARPVLILLWAGAASSVAAVLAGQQLAEQRGVSELHETSGKLLAIASLLLAVIGYFWNAQLKAHVSGNTEAANSGLMKTWAALGLALSAAAMVGVVVAGHSGATSVWGNQSAAGSSQDGTGGESFTPRDPDQTASPAPRPTDNQRPSSSPTPTPTSTQKSYTAAEVAKHNTPTDCWTMIAKQAFDITDWVNRHPGGPKVISALCGVNGNDAFVGQHGTTGEPVQVLRNFWLGPISG